MDELKIPCSMYVVTECISKDKPTWTFEIDYLFYNTRKLQIDWTTDVSFIPPEFRKTKFENNKELISFCLKFKQYIKIIPEEKREMLIQDLFNSFNDVHIPSGLMMNWEEINQIMNAGVEVGSHSVTHPPLSTLNTTSLKKELQQSREDFFKYTSSCPRIISYPLGIYNQNVKEAAQTAGYDYGLAVNHKSFNMDTGDKFEIPRIELYNEPFWKSLLRIEGYA